MSTLQIEKIIPMERGYLLGLFLGDGYANYYDKNKQYKIIYTLNSEKDKDIQRTLSLILNKAKIGHYVIKDKRFNANMIRISGKEFYSYLIELKNEFNKDVLFFDKSFLLGVLSGFIDAEGWVGNGTICITQKDGKLIKKMKEILGLFDINCTLKHKLNYPSGTIWRGFISTTFKYLPHASQKVRRVYSCSS